MSYLNTKAIYRADTSDVDSFGRDRVSQLTTQIDIKQIHDQQPLLIDIVTSGTATDTYDMTNSSTELATVATSDYAISQTFQRFNYQSGKSQKFTMTFSGFDAETNIVKRVGYFSSSTTAPYTASQDGIYLENDGTDVRIKVYKSGTETFNVAQSSWNDPLDGTGASGVTIDWSLSQIMDVDFGWLGSNRIRLAFVVGGQTIQAHELLTSNVNAEPWCTSPNQPLRWEIRQSGAGSGSFDYVCATVGTEGSINQIGKVLSDNAGTNDLQFNSTGTKYAGIGIRLKDDHLDAVIDIVAFNYMAETNDRALWELILNPTVTGTFTYSDVTNSAVQTSIGNQTAGAAPTVSGGTVIDSGYVDQLGRVNGVVNSAIKIGTAIDGTRDEIVLCVTPIQAGLDAFVSMNWKELT